MKRIAALALALLATAALAATQSITLAPGDSVTVTAAQQGGSPPPVITPTPVPTPPPTPGPSEFPTAQECGVAGSVWYREMSWQSPARLYQPMGVFDAIVVKFTTGGTLSTPGQLPRISAAEWNSPPSARIGTLSTKRCDFAQQAKWGANLGSDAARTTSIQGVFLIGGNDWYYPSFPPNTDVYLNIKNATDPSCSQSCEMFVDLVKSGGL